jgi:tripartite-type tricarboxylate transporter receptor subunit TctC
MKNIFVTLSACIGLAMASPPVSAQAVSDGVYKIVVGFPAGTSPDIAARVIAPAIAKELGASVIVENKPGAGGNIGVAQVAKATDGYTIGLTTNGPLTTAGLLYKNPGFNAKSDLIPLGLVASSPLVLVVAASGPLNSTKDLADKLRADTKGLTYGSVGAGSGSHLTGELFSQRAKVPAVHVPYPGFPAVLNDVASERVDFAFVAPSIAEPLIRSGKIKALGVSSKGIYAGMPNLKPIASTKGLESFSSEVWIALFQGKSAPTAIRNSVRNATSAAMANRLTELGWSYIGGSEGALILRMEEDTARFGNLIRRMNLKLD